LTTIELTIPGLSPQWDLREEMEDIAIHLENSIQRNFQAGGRPVKWATLKKGGASHLYDTGHLFNSIDHASGDDWAEAGTNVHYAGVHQDGYSPMNIPPRRFLVFQEEDKAFILQRMARAIGEVFTPKKRRKITIRGK
jgi:phage virion morphogenesis protein